MKKIELMYISMNFAEDSVKRIEQQAQQLLRKHKLQSSDYINYEKAYKELLDHIVSEKSFISSAKRLADAIDMD